MTRRTPSKPARENSPRFPGESGGGSKPAGPSGAALDMIDRVLFCALLALLCARPLLSETYEHLELSFLNTIAAPGGPTPATTAWLDTVTLTAAGLALARGGRWRGNRAVAAGIALLAAGIVVSSLGAGDRHLARFAGTSMLVAVLAGAALASLLRERWMLHLLVAGLLAAGCTTAVRCVLQRTWERAATIEVWEQEQKPALLREGRNLDDPLIVNFERRMRSPEVDGFLAHPNVTGSCLMMALLTTFGLLAAGVCRSRRTGATAAAPRARSEIDPRWLAWPALAALGALLAVGVWLTGSRGALAAGVIGVVLLVVLGGGARWAARHGSPVLLALAAVYLAGIGGVAAYGVRHGTLPHPSLAFRWYYWTTAVRAWQDAPLTGVGRGNFAAAYMQYKPAEGTEEVRDPHNIWLSLLVELGPLGLAGGVVLVAAGILAALRRLGAGADATDRLPGEGGGEDPIRTVATRAVPVALGVLLLHALLSGGVLVNSGTLVLWGVFVAGVWAGTFAVALSVLHLADRGARPAAWLTAGLLAAVLAALIHALLDFALTTAGGLACFVLCAVGAAGVRRCVTDEAQKARPGRWRVLAPAVAALGLIAGQLVLVTLQVQSATGQRARLDDVLRQRPPAPASVAFAAARTAAEQSCGDAVVFRAGVRALLEVCGRPDLAEAARLAWLSEAQQQAARLVRVSAGDTNAHTLLAEADDALAALHERRGDAEDSARFAGYAADAWDRAVRLYPTNPRTRISAGLAWFAVWQKNHQPEGARRARGHFAAALRIDDCRAPEEVVRLRPQDRARVVAYLAQLDVGLAPTTTQEHGRSEAARPR